MRTTSLTLSRKVGEAILLVIDGVQVRIEVAQLRAGRVRLRTSAPADVRIWRAELVGEQSRDHGLRVVALAAE